VLDGVHIGATWRILLNRPCAVAMRPYVKLLRPPAILVVDNCTSQNVGTHIHTYRMAPMSVTLSELEGHFGCLTPLLTPIIRKI